MKGRAPLALERMWVLEDSETGMLVYPEYPELLRSAGRCRVPPMLVVYSKTVAHKLAAEARRAGLVWRPTPLLAVSAVADPASVRVRPG